MNLTMESQMTLLGKSMGQKGSATVNFMRNFLALSKDVAFHPCASAQGRDSKEDERVRGRRRKGRETIPRHGRYAAFFRRPT